MIHLFFIRPVRAPVITSFFDSVPNNLAIQIRPSDLSVYYLEIEAAETCHGANQHPQPEEFVQGEGLHSAITCLVKERDDLGATGANSHHDGIIFLSSLESRSIRYRLVTIVL